MKNLKSLIAILLTGIFLISLNLSVYAINENDTQSVKTSNPIEEIITSYANPNGRILSVANLGNPRLYPENSLEGIKSCIEIGVDIVSVTVQMTKDGQFVLLSSSSLSNMCVNKEDGSVAIGKTTDYTLKELQEKFLLREGHGGKDSAATKYTICSLSEAITTCKNNMMIMINNGWSFAEEINALARSMDACSIIIIRNVPTATDAANFINKAGVPICHVSTHFTKDSEDSAKTFVSASLENGAKIVELEADKSRSTIFNQSVLDKFETSGRAFVSTTTPSRCGGRDDIPADWAELIEKGYSIIETDYPRDLVNYIRQIESCRTELTSLIMQAQGLNTSKYTKETAKDLASTLKDAESISATGCVSLTQIEIAKYNIQESLDSLNVKTGNEKTTLPVWAIILIVVGVIILIVILVIFGLRFFNKAKAKKRKMSKFKDNFKNKAPKANDNLTSITGEDISTDDFEEEFEDDDISSTVDDESVLENNDSLETDEPVKEQLPFGEVSTDEEDL
ncbi:MAG: glycerophosphodiester phosphodiesterase family protein [Oscillospiraceae bacterium]|nr:glycerophosphodiester phosphodiesterase family protein [Oscillospiraceae bacterium]